MQHHSTASSRQHLRVLILIENLPLDRDSRVQRQCRSLIGAGHSVTVICPRRDSRRPPPEIGPVRLITYPRSRDATTGLGYILEYGYSLFMTAILVFWVAITSG